jgi:uncharacterized protein
MRAAQGEGHAEGRSSAARLALALLPAALLPFLSSLFYFVFFSAHPAARVAYILTKVFTLAWPLLAFRFVLGEPFPGPVAPFRRRLGALPLGILSGLLMGATLVGLMATPVGGVVSGSVGAIREKAVQLGILAWYWPFALFLSLFNSLVEEYYWRWFVYGRLRRVWPGWRAHLLAGLAFGAHHAVVISQFISPGWGLVAGAVVALGGIILSVLFERQGTVAGAWVCHLIADLCIMGVGHWLLF